MLRQIKAVIVGGTGGAGDNAVPGYTEIDKAPGGDWQLGLDGKQWMIPNLTPLITYDPTVIDLTDKNLYSFFQINKEGKPVYQRVWLVNKDTGAGEDHNGKAIVIETSHIKEVVEIDPEPDPDPEPEPVDDWIEYDYKMENGRLYLRKK